MGHLSPAVDFRLRAVNLSEKDNVSGKENTGKPIR